jgi:hypothetical protein
MFNRYLLITFVPGLLILAVAISVESVKALLLSECDSKFGCLGGIQFAAFISAIAAASSSVGLAVSSMMNRHAIANMSWRLLVVACLIIAMILWLLLQTIAYWPLEIPITILIWCAISAALSWAVTFLLARY